MLKLEHMAHIAETRSQDSWRVAAGGQQCDTRICAGTLSVGYRLDNNGLAALMHAYSCESSDQPVFGQPARGAPDS